MKDKKGITLIALVLTIIIIMILASIAIYTGASIVRYTKFSKAKAEIQIVQAYVNEWYKEYERATDQEKIEFLNTHGQNTDACDMIQLSETFKGAGINDEGKFANYRFFSEDYIKEKMGLDASYDYLISIKDRSTILFNGIIYNKQSYYTMEDFGIQNIKGLTKNDHIFFYLMQGDSTDIIISDVKIKYYTQTNTGAIKERDENISKFIVEYTKVGEDNWINVTKDVIKYDDNGIKYKFTAMSEGTFSVRITSMDKKETYTENITLTRTNLTLKEREAIAKHNELFPDDRIEELQNAVPNYLKDDSKIKTVLTGNVPIPVESYYIEGSENTGVVIEYKGSQFVWVPIPVTAGNDLFAKGTTKPMARKTAGTDSNNKDNYQGVLYEYSDSGSGPESIERSDYREPDILSSSSEGDWSTASNKGYSLIKQYITGMQEKTNEQIQAQWTKQVQEEYNEMIDSVAKYGGFFVGRYETSYDGTKVASKKEVFPMTALTTLTSSSATWYGMYQKQKNFTTNTDMMQANMIWGSQYDALLNWVITGVDKTKVLASNNGNHQGASVGAVACGSYENGKDRINNIFDLEGNVWEWTQECYGTDGRTVRGGYYQTTYTPARRGRSYPYNALQTHGSRITLYIK